MKPIVDLREQLSRFLLLACVFFLPWQTRWIFSGVVIAGTQSQYGQWSIYASEVLVFIVLCLRGRPQFASRDRWVVQGVFFFLAALFFSLGLTQFFSISFAQTIHVLFACVLFFLLIDERTDMKELLIAFVAGLLPATLLAWWQVLTGFSPASTWLGLSLQRAQDAGTAVVQTDVGRLLRGYGSFPHPNIFGGYVAVALLVLAWLVQFIRTRRTFVLAVVPVVLLSSTLLVTFSRSAWLGLGLGFLTLLVLLLKYRRVPTRFAFVLMGVGCVSVLSAIILFFPHIFTRITATGSVETLSVVDRTSQYTWFDDVFFVNPIFGVGSGTYVFVLEAINPGFEVYVYQPLHNTWLLIASELGILGLAALFYVLLRIDQQTAQATKRAGGIIGVSLGVTLIVIGLFDHYLWSLWPGLALSVLTLAIMLKFSNSPHNFDAS